MIQVFTVDFEVVGKGASISPTSAIMVKNHVKWREDIWDAALKSGGGAKMDAKAAIPLFPLPKTNAA